MKRISSQALTVGLFAVALVVCLTVIVVGFQRQGISNQDLRARTVRLQGRIDDQAKQITALVENSATLAKNVEPATISAFTALIVRCLENYGDHRFNQAVPLLDGCPPRPAGGIP